MEIKETSQLPSNANTVWNCIGDFGAVGDWHPMLEHVRSEGNKRGARRYVTANDGSKQVEQLEVYDPDRRFYRYSMVETTLPFCDYSAEFRVDEAGPDASVVTWSAHFAVWGVQEQDGAEPIRQFLKAGTGALARRFEDASTSGPGSR
jgi:mxaD protein